MRMTTERSELGDYLKSRLPKDVESEIEKGKQLFEETKPKTPLLKRRAVWIGLAVLHGLLLVGGVWLGCYVGYEVSIPKWMQFPAILTSVIAGITLFVFCMLCGLKASECTE